MNKKIKQLFVSLFLLVGIMSFAAAVMPISETMAQATAPKDIQGGLTDVGGAYPENVGSNSTAVDIPGMAKKIINWALYLAGMIAVIFVIIGGFLYMTSAGDAGQAGKGKTTLINAIIGLVIIVLSYVIVQTVYTFLIS